jgi:hypothetical protein
MNALKKQLSATPTPSSTADAGTSIAEIRRVYADRCEVAVDNTGIPFDALLPLGSVLPFIGQRACVIKDTVNDQWLVTALFPSYDSPSAVGAATTPSNSAPLLTFDKESRTVTLDVTRMEIKALESIELRCGDARFRLTMQGAVLLSGETITSTAIGEHRIEGASIDLN